MLFVTAQADQRQGLESLETTRETAPPVTPELVLVQQGNMTIPIVAETRIPNMVVRVSKLWDTS